MNEYVIVTGPGRSGTSLAMQLCEAAGVRVSEDVVPANRANPLGHYEDSEVVRLNRRVLRAFGRDSLFGQTYPLPDRWQQRPVVERVGEELIRHLGTLRSSHAGAWAIKDPRISVLMPLWTHALSAAGVAPRYVLCVRNPKVVARSVQMAYGVRPECGELLWLNRVCHAVSGIDGEFFLFHYEDFLENTESAIERLVEYLPGIGLSGPAARQDSELVSTIKHGLNRAKVDGPAGNALVRRLYRELRKRRGVTAYDSALSEIVDRFLANCREYRGWLSSLDAAFDQRRALQRTMQRVEEEKEEAERLTASVRSQLDDSVREWREHLRTRRREQNRLARAGSMESAGSATAGGAGQSDQKARRDQKGPKASPEHEHQLVLARCLKLAVARSCAERLQAAMPEGADVPERVAPRPKAPQAGRESSAPGRRKVLFVGPIGFREGVWDTRVKYILPDLFDELHSVADMHMLTGPVPKFARAGLRVLEDRYGVQHWEAARKPARMDLLDLWSCEAMRVFEHVQPDIITNVFGATSTGYVVGLVGYLTGVRSVVRVAGDEIRVRELMGRYADAPQDRESDVWYQNMGFAMAETIITMAPWEQTRVQGIVSDPGKVQLCMRGIDLNKFDPAGTVSTEKGDVFLFVGRNAYEKGIDIIEAASKLVMRKAPKVRFRFAGNFEPQRVENREFVGFVQAEDLPAAYADADAYILVSRTEGFPQALAEAMAMGKPCILSRHIFGDMFRHDEDALLVSEEPSELAAAVIRIHEDRKLRERLSRAALRIAAEKLDRRRWFGKYRSALLGEGLSSNLLAAARA